MQTCFEYLGYKPDDFPESNRASQEVLSLPIFAELTDTQISRVASVLADATTARDDTEVSRQQGFGAAGSVDLVNSVAPAARLCQPHRGQDRLNHSGRVRWCLRIPGPVECRSMSGAGTDNGQSEGNVHSGIKANQFLSGCAPDHGTSR